MSLPLGYEFVYPIGDFVGESQWTPTPAGTHFTTIDEGLEPPAGPNDADFIYAFHNQRIDSYYIGAGSPGRNLVEEFIWQFRYAGTAYTDNPGLKIEFWVAGIKRGEEGFNIETGGDNIFVEGQVEFKNLNIVGADWYAGPRIMKHISVFPALGQWKAPDFKQLPGD